MKKLIACCLILLCLCGCKQSVEPAQIATTTLPIYEFTSALCEGTGITTTCLITEDVSCLHNYTLQVNQMRAIEASQITIISGAGLEDFLEDALYASDKIIDASEGIQLIHSEHTAHNDQESDHNHHNDPHYWLSPSNAKIMAKNICNNLIAEYPQHSSTFTENYLNLEFKLQSLQQYAENALSELDCREIITFHDGFSYLADTFGLTIIKAIEEESGAEASAAELIELIKLVEANQLPAIFTEKNGSDAAASIICQETGADIFSLDMAITGTSYFDAMYHNINTIKEALE